MKILVAGSYGQLGNELKDKSVLLPDWKFVFTDVDTLDITSEKKVQSSFQKNKPDFVINCAAYTAVDKAETEIALATKINATAPGMLAKAAREISARIIHISTDYVFDGLACVPYSESDKVNPQNIYGKTKLQGEINVWNENPETIILRTSWLYSSFGHNFVRTMLGLGSERDIINVVFDQVGTPTYAGDLANVILAIIKKSDLDPKDFFPGIYNYSNEGVASWYDFAKAIFEISGIECQVSPVLSKEFQTPAKRPSYSVLDKSKIRDAFNIEIPYWKDSLKVCIEEIKKI